MSYTQWLKIGWSQINITPTRPVPIVGQMYQRISQYVHDPITATALVLDNGDDQAVFLSADMVEVSLEALKAVENNLKIYKELDFSKVSFHITHTHNSTVFSNDFLRQDNETVFGKEILPQIDTPENIFTGDEAMTFLVGKLTELIAKAWETRKPGGISYAQDYAAVAFNRRPVFQIDGKKETVMYGDCSKSSFLHFEGGSDHTADMLYTWNTEGDLTGVMVDVPCPSQVYELHSFISADFWAPARHALREKLGNIYVLPACGAAGDQNPLDLVRISKNNQKALLEWGGQTGEVFRNFDMTIECQSIGERICEAVVRGYKSARNTIDYNPLFNHEVIDLNLPLRLVSREEYDNAVQEVELIKKKFSTKNPMKMQDVVRAFEPQGVVMRWNMQQQNQHYCFKMHILRIGDIAIATNPFELFHEYGLRIKARAKAEQVFVIQLANGLGGYLPTEAAVAGGSYSSKPASTMCDSDGGNLLVEETLSAINKMWEQG